MSDAPERIWLQHDPNDENGGELPADWTTGEVTWCWEPIGSSDIGYVRADLYDQQAAEIERLKALALAGRELADALYVFDDLADDWEARAPGLTDNDLVNQDTTIGDLRQAKAALARWKEAGGEDE